MEKTIKSNKKFLIIFFIISFLILFPFQGQKKVIALSIEEEETLGKEFYNSISKQLNMIQDPFAEEYINELGNYLVDSLDTRPFHFKFYIVKDKQLNAFAGPGGQIFIYTGLIEAMDKIDELAAVISHEIGHVSSRHISHRIEKNQKIGIATMAGMLAGILVGGEASEAIITGSMAAGQQKMLSYSRDDERQADQLGFRYSSLSGFDPSALVSALAKLQRGQWGINETPPYLLTHPMGPERMANIEALLTSNTYTPNSKKAEQFRRQYPLLKTILRAKGYDTHDAEAFFKKELSNSESPLANLGIAIILKDKAKYSMAIEHFQKAIDGLSEPLPAIRYLSETYQLKGENEKSIKILESALKSNSYDKATLFLLANSYQNIEEYSKATQLYEKLTFMEPVKDEVYYNLGVVLGRQEKLGLAHYNFGLFNNRQGRMKEARFHFEKAMELSKDDPDLQELIKKAMKGLKKLKPDEKTAITPPTQDISALFHDPNQTLFLSLCQHPFYFQSEDKQPLYCNKGQHHQSLS